MESAPNPGPGKSVRELRFAVMCNGTVFSEWQARCIKQILELGNVKPVLLIVDDDAASNSTFAKLGKLDPKQILFQTYSHLLSRPASSRPVDMTGEFAGVPIIKCKTIKRRTFSQYFYEDDLDKIREFAPDFILRFGFNIIRGDILKVAPYGVWSFHHGDETKYRGSPPCFWEIYEGDPVSGAILQRLTNRLDGGIVLKKGLFPTISYSYAANLDRVFLGSASWPAQVCLDILNGHTEDIDATPSRTTAPIYHSPTNGQMIRLLAKLANNFLGKLRDLLFRHEQWNIGIIKEPIAEFLKPDVDHIIQWLPQPKQSHFIADPFGVTSDNGVLVLCEKFGHGSQKGAISSIDVSNSGSIIKDETVIREPFHLSYPYLIERNGEYYCVPETAEIREVRLYKAAPFPSKWVRVATLLEDFPGVDMTVFKHEGRWWMAGTNADDGKYCKLFVWYANDLFGPWQAHALNPVKIDVRSARPAGTPFEQNGCLFRPAQDCSETYGGRIVINQVTRLTPTAFAETPAKIIEPDINSPYGYGIHTISSAGQFTLVDGKRYLFSIGGLLQSFLVLFTKLRRGVNGIS